MDGRKHELLQKIGMWLQEQRKQQGYSLKQASYLSGLPVSRIDAMEKGHVSIPISDFSTIVQSYNIDMWKAATFLHELQKSFLTKDS